MGGRIRTGGRKPCTDGHPLGSIMEIPDIPGGPVWGGGCVWWFLMGHSGHSFIVHLPSFCGFLLSRHQGPVTPNIWMS